MSHAGYGFRVSKQPEKTQKTNWKNTKWNYLWSDRMVYTVDGVDHLSFCKGKFHAKAD